MLADTRLGRYLVQSQLGHGGMGAVYRAHDTLLDRGVALKVLRDDAENGDGDRRRLLREAQAAAKLDHPNIVRVYDVAELDGSLCIAMELVEGTTLRERTHGADHDLDTRIGWLLDIAHALEAAHAAGVVHRDLKPDNVMLRSDGVLKVLDFGIAKLVRHDIDTLDLDTVTDDGELVGTPAYMSPEQLSQLRVDGRTDQFAWGVLAFELLTGQLPWGERDLLQTLTAVLRQEAPRACDLVPELGQAVSAVIARTLAKDPALRFATITDAASALERAHTPRRQSFVPPVADPLLSLAPTQPVVRARRWRLPLMMAGWLAVLGVGAAFHRCTEAPPAAPNAPSGATASSSPRAVTDLEAPETTSPAALAAYQSYLTGYRSGSRSLEELNRAIELDPELAVAHVRLALRSYVWQPDTARIHAAKAISLRDRLVPRDRAMLSMVEPLVMAQPADHAAWLVAATEATNAFPHDAELRWFQGWAYGMNRQVDQARRAFREATELDPGFAWAWQFLAESNAKRGHVDEARGQVDACLEANPAADTCRLIRIVLQSTAGRCADVLEDIDRLLLAQPGDVPMLERRSFALVALGKPYEAAEATLARIERVAEAESWRASRHRAQLRAFRGDFEGALTAVDEWEAAVAKSTFEVVHAAPTALRAELLIEMGELERARRLADDYFNRRAAWVPDPRRSEFAIAEDARPVLWEAQRLAGDAAANAARIAWRDAYLAAGRSLAQLAWLHVDAAFARDEAEARAALAAIPQDGLPTYAPLSPVHALRGRVLARAGKTHQAIEQLELAVAECRRFKHPMVYSRALADLGEAYERAGDRRACQSYAALLERWSPARSVTAAKVARRAAALSCDDAP
ncbi:MAG: protein kinase [Polyangiaceae bacterium]